TVQRKRLPMPFMVAFHDAGVLEEARARSIAGHFPHLRLVSLAPGADVDALPAHLRARVVAEPSAALLDGGINALLSSARAATAVIAAQVAASDLLTWDQVADAYERWIQEQYLPANALLSTFTPEGLYPLGLAAERITMELIGSCGAVFLERAVPEMGP